MENKTITMLACQRQLADMFEGSVFPLYNWILYYYDSVYLGISEEYGIQDVVLQAYFSKCPFSPLSRAGKAACTVTRGELIYRDKDGTNGRAVRVEA